MNRLQHIPEPGQLVDVRQRRYVVLDIQQYATEFVIKLLKKRLFSSPASFLTTLTKHQNTLTEAKQHTSVTRRPSVGILRTMVEQLDEESDNDETLDDATKDGKECA